MFDSIISSKRTGKSRQEDFLESLIQKHTKNGSQEDSNDKLTDKQLKDNILTLLIAGHDTTTAALTWVIKLLGENSDVLARLRVMVHIIALFPKNSNNFKDYFYWETNSKFCRKNTWIYEKTGKKDQLSPGQKP